MLLYMRLVALDGKRQTLSMAIVSAEWPGGAGPWAAGGVCNRGSGVGLSTRRWVVARNGSRGGSRAVAAVGT